MIKALEIVQTEDGEYLSAPFHREVMVDADLWLEWWGCERRLEFVAENGDPVVYVLDRADPVNPGVVIFKREGL